MSAAHPVTRAERGFVEVDGRRLHFVRRGRGPAVVLLHASPCSAKVMEPIQALWGNEFTTFAFDLPGFGLSESPDGEITIGVLASIIVEGMRKLGIQQAALYGRHTGASVALEIALQHPEMVSMLLTDGLPIFAAPYTEERLSKYLPPIEPRWDGGHLTWTFFRYREQHMFWPWDYSGLAHRADADMPDLDFLHRGALELLEAAKTYAQTYRAAFIYETLPLVDAVKVPVYWGNRPGDSQFKTIPRYPEGAPIHVMSRDNQVAMHEELELLRLHAATGSVPDQTSRFTLVDRPSDLEDYISTRHGSVRAIGSGLDRTETPTIFMHDLPGGVALHAEEIAEFGKTRPVVGFELAGNGESFTTNAPDLSVWVQQVEDVCAALGWKRVSIYAHGTSAAVALAFAQSHPDMVERVELRSPPVIGEADRAEFVEKYAPDITPSSDGGYLLRLWHHLRDQELWFPHYRQDHSARKTTEPRIDPDLLTRRCVALLKQPQHYRRIWQQVLKQDIQAAISACPVPVSLLVIDTDVFAHTAVGIRDSLQA